MQIIIADRSPLSAIFYTRTDGGLLQPLIEQYVRELRVAADVHIHTVHLRTERMLLWERIQQRLLLEPERVSLREDKMDWMDAVLSFYEGMPWDVTVTNNEVTMPELVTSVMTQLSALSDAVKIAVDANSHVVNMWTSGSSLSLSTGSHSSSGSDSETSCRTPEGQRDTLMSGTGMFEVDPATPLSTLMLGASIDDSSCFPSTLKQHASASNDTTLEMDGFSSGSGSAFTQCDESAETYTITPIKAARDGHGHSFPALLATPQQA